MEARLKRLEEVKALLVVDIPIAEIAKTLNVTTKTIRNDIKAIKKGILSKLRENAFDSVIMEIGLNTELVRKNLWKLFSQSSHDNIKLGALNALVKLLSDKTNLLGKLGLVEYVEKHEVGFDYDAFRKWCFDGEPEKEGTGDSKAVVQQDGENPISISKKDIPKQRKNKDSKQEPTDRNKH